MVGAEYNAVVASRLVIVLGAGHRIDPSRGGLTDVV
jgi:hypothetical protein